MNLSRLFAPIALVSAIALSGISGSALADTTLRIGVTPVPHADIVNFIKPTLEKEGVKLEVVEFNDYRKLFKTPISERWGKQICLNE